jgi:hypothetical protein
LNTNPTPLSLGDPLDLDDGRRAAARLARQCRDAVDALDRAVQSHAQAELTYRKAHAAKLVELRSEAIPATLCQDLSKGDPKVGQLKYERDLAKGIIDVSRERLRQLDGERASLRQLLEWSQKFEARSFTPQVVA